MFTDYQKISCVMVTKDRDISASVHCFHQQIYPHKELIILSHGSNLSHCREYLSDNVQVVECKPQLTLGEMRDIAVELSSGQFVCQWDDDDLYGPYRLLRQYKPIASSHKVDASFCSEYLKYLVGEKKVYWVDMEDGVEDYVDSLEHYPYRKFLSGSIMFRKSLYYENGYSLYQKIDKEEDLGLAKKLARRSVSVRGLNYIYVYHGQNTYGYDHHCKTGFHKKKIIDEKCLLNHQKGIEDLFSFCRMPDVDVCFSSMVNFDYHTSAELEEDVAFTYKEQNEV